MKIHVQKASRAYIYSLFFIALLSHKDAQAMCVMQQYDATIFLHLSENCIFSEFYELTRNTEGNIKISRVFTTAKVYVRWLYFSCFSFEKFIQNNVSETNKEKTIHTMLDWISFVSGSSLYKKNKPKAKQKNHQHQRVDVQQMLHFASTKLLCLLIASIFNMFFASLLMVVRKDFLLLIQNHFFNVITTFYVYEIISAIHNTLKEHIRKNRF